MICQLYGFESNSGKGLAYHVKMQHHINSKEYYDKFYGPSYCSVCGKPNRFIGLAQGYTNYCSKKCYCSTKEFSNHMKDVATNYWTIDRTNRNIKISQTAKNKNKNIQENLGYPLQDMIQKYGEVWYKHRVVPIHYYKNCAYIKVEDESYIIDYLQNIKEFKSSYEYDIYKSILTYYSGEVYHNYKIDKYEVDIFIPDLNLIIEYNGKYWHDFRINEQEKYNNYKKFYKVFIIEESDNYDLFLEKLHELQKYIFQLMTI